MSETAATIHPEESTRAGLEQPARRPRLAVAILVAAVALAATLVTAATPAGAAVSTSSGGYADTRMVCVNWTMTGGVPNKYLALDVRNLRGFDYARVYRNGSHGGSGWVTGSAQSAYWVPAHQVQRMQISATRSATSLIVQYADWNGRQWVYASELAVRTDGRGVWC